MDFIEFWTVCSSNGIILDEEQMRQVERYNNELKYWNAKVNLISRQDEGNILVRHILHSMSCLKYIDLPPKSNCIDIGTGGGLPGIPIKIAKPDIRMLLVDSISKKITMTDMLAKHTGQRNIRALRIRADELAQNSDHITKYDFVFSRAVVKTQLIISWVKKLLKNTGKIVLYKGGDIAEELDQASKYFPDFTFKEYNISLFGAKWFKEEQKKILICEFKDK